MRLNRARVRETALLILVGALVSAHLSLNYVRVNRPFLDLNLFVQGKLLLPFQYRILTAPLYSLLLRKFGHSSLLTARTMPDYLRSPSSLAYCCVAAISTFLSLCTAYILSVRIFGKGLWALLCVSALVVYLYLTFCLNPNLAFVLPYDLPSVFLLSLCLLCIVQEHYLALLLVFGIATLNRETSFLIIVFMTVSWRTHMANSWPSKIAPLILTWLAIKIALSRVIHGAGPGPDTIGGFMQLRLLSNLREILKPWQWPALLPAFLPVAASASVLRHSAGPEEQTWAATHLLGFLIFFLLAGIAEQRAFGDLVVFAAISSTFWLRKALCLYCAGKSEWTGTRSEGQQERLRAD